MTRFLSFLLLITAIITFPAGLVIASTLDLAAFLQAAADAARPTVTLRADGEMTSDNPEHPLRDQIILLHRPNNDVFVELRTVGVKLLMLKGGSEAYLVSADEPAAKTLPLNAAIAASDWGSRGRNSIPGNIVLLS